MTILQVCAIRDVAVNAFNRPFFVQSLGLACRVFEDEVRRSSPDNPMTAHPADFALFHLGEFDEESGVFKCLDIPVRLMEATSAVIAKEV